MAVKAAEVEAELIDAICERVRDRLPEENASICESFVRQYYHWVPSTDLAERSPLDLYGAAVAHWNLMQQRPPGEAKVRVYNPEFEQHGWQSPHTVIEVVSDDMPFIVDSVTMELGRHGYGIDLVIHPVIRVKRDDKNRVTEILDPGADADDNACAESVLHAEVSRAHDPKALKELRQHIERVLHEVRAAVDDWQAMRDRCAELAERLTENPPPIDETEIKQVKSFLEWLADDNFTFLGYREYCLNEEEDGEAVLEAVQDTGLGVLRGEPKNLKTKLGDKGLALGKAPHVLLLTKANSRATVHRPAYLDYIGVKKFDDQGEVVGENRFLGLYTTAAYKSSPLDIPLLREKVESVLEKAGFPRASHDTKALLDILESYPRDSLFQMEADELFDVAMGILGLGERQRLRLFAWRDPLDRFIECHVCIPRDRFNTENREKIGRILCEAAGGTQLDWSLQLSESLLARVHYIVRRADGPPKSFDLSEMESKLVEATRAWTDDLKDALLEKHGEEHGTKLFKRYERAFPPGYRSDCLARFAVGDIERLEELAEGKEPIISLYRPLENPEGIIRVKLFSSGGVLLSDVLPKFEHMGTKVADERPYEIRPADRDRVHIYAFGLRGDADDLEQVRGPMREAFLGVWHGELEDDGLNALVLKAELTGREVTVIRATAKYLRQGGIAFSDAYMERTLLAHPDIARQLVDLFKARFDPDREASEQEREHRVGKVHDQVEQAIDEVESLDEDRILRAFMSVICAMLRTNYYRKDDDGRPRPYLSFKLDPKQIPTLPLPRPQFEIFVYSPRFEGVHLRGGKVARGGLRWSDRPEDFRTEILGLMKAQMVKNAMIVPVGSKGGFVLKRPPKEREALQDEAIECYKMFLSGLLDVTDNIVDDEIKPPDRVVRYDDDDPYLVVAADKGTASFSDIANQVSESYGFWLGDAFASGGSKGYDHKAMGITARGAWEPVKRHFRELGTNIQETDFTVVGIGDMSGDVFGNGMLLSKHIRLIAAFNHMHVFLDPDPDPEESFKERKRMFDKGRSSWSDYDESKISEGGGIYERTAKSITISKQAREALGIDKEKLSPTDLIREILKAPVDLLWNGGIGTYVKASTESHGDAGDKANDAVRVDGKDVRCRVVGEGGNLGFTQLGRIEYSREGGPEGDGGRINTDAIDNVGGVNCSDHEVNIKILLDKLVAGGDLTEKQRNELLFEMTDSVAEQVLYGSYTQTQAMSLALAQAVPMIDVHGRLIRHLEHVAGLNRQIEFLPDDDQIADRKASHQGLCRPELAVVMAYCKIRFYTQLLDSDLPEDEYLRHDLERYFPAPLPERYSEQMGEHNLRREIIATVFANQLVDRAGTTFAFRLGEETGVRPASLARGYAVAREVFDMRSFWNAVEELDNEVSADVQLEMLIEGRRLVERSTRWLVRAYPDEFDIAVTIRYFEQGAKTLAEAMPDVLQGVDREAYDHRLEELKSSGVPKELAARSAGMPSMIAVFDIVEAAKASQRKQEMVMEVYFLLGAQLDLNWLRDRIIELPRANRWQALARASLRDELYSLHRAITQDVLHVSGRTSDPQEAIDKWHERNEQQVERALSMIGDVRASRSYDTTTLPVALREVRSLIRGQSLDGAQRSGSVTMAG
jgi:glutamate dehydrogenase